MTDTDGNHMLIVGATGDIDTFLDRPLLSSRNSGKNDWWSEVTLLFWGSATKVFSESNRIASLRLSHASDRWHVKACIACAKNLGATDMTDEMGIELINGGEFLTEWIKSGRHHVMV